MKILALETSTLLGGVALFEDNIKVSERSSLRQKSHSEVINKFVEEILQEQKINLKDIDYYAVGVGPGSFTGIRTALNIGKTFAYSHKKPMVEIDSLINLAQTAINTKSLIPNNYIFSIINAYKNMVYYGIFEHTELGEAKYFEGPSVVHVNQLEQVIEKISANKQVTVVGDGYGAYSRFFSKKLIQRLHRPVTTEINYPTVATLGLLAYEKIKNSQTKDWNLILPLYIRSSEAEENKKGLIYIPLHLNNNEE